MTDFFSTPQNMCMIYTDKTIDTEGNPLHNCMIFNKSRIYKAEIPLANDIYNDFYKLRSDAKKSDYTEVDFNTEKTPNKFAEDFFKIKQIDMSYANGLIAAFFTNKKNFDNVVNYLFKERMVTSMTKIHE
jgi:hypothetical protein